MNKFFDYIFYRVYKQYEKWRESYPYPFAEGVLVIIQGFMILCVLTLLSTLNVLPRKTENHKIFALVCLVILYIINHVRYKKRYIEIIETFEKVDDINKRRNGILIVILIIVVILFPMVVGVLRNNFGYYI